MVFPQVDGVPNTQHSLGVGNMVLLHTTDSQVAWNGQVLSGLKGPLLYQSGVSTVSLILERMQVDADEAAPMAYTLARMLLKGRSNAGIISEYDALELIEQAEFKGQFEVKPFVMRQGLSGLQQAVVPSASTGRRANLGANWRYGAIH